MKIETRRLYLDDAESVNKLSAQLGYSLTVEETTDCIRNVLGCADHFALVAVSEGIVIGWVHAFKAVRIESRAFIEIAGLVVDENHRGKGIGKTLINEIRKWCLANGIHTLRLRTNTQRLETHRFYEAFGFTNTKDQKVYELQVYQ